MIHVGVYVLRLEKYQKRIANRIGALEPLLTGAALSKSAVSRLVLPRRKLPHLARADLAEEKIVYLYLDAIYPKVRSGGKVVSLPVLVALGVRENGEKVLLSLMTPTRRALLATENGGSSAGK